MGLLSADNPRDTAISWAFVVVQFALLVVILVLPADDVWSVSTGMARGWRMLGWIGAAILVVGLVNLGRSLTPLPTPVPHGELRTNGLFRWVRHPIYSGIMALALGSAVPSGNPLTLAATVALIAWFMAKARWEERHLRQRYAGYDEYAAHTPRFVPGWPFGADRA